MFSINQDGFHSIAEIRNNEKISILLHLLKSKNQQRMWEDKLPTDLPNYTVSAVLQHAWYDPLEKPIQTKNTSKICNKRNNFFFFPQKQFTLRSTISSCLFLSFFYLNNYFLFWINVFWVFHVKYLHCFSSCWFYTFQIH